MLQKLLFYSKRIKQQRLLIKKKVIVSSEVSITEDCVLEGNNYIGEATCIYKSKIGFGSYMGAKCRISSSVVGRYCSFSNNVIIVAGQHPTHKFVSTHPAFYSNNNEHIISYVNQQLFEEYKYADRENQKLVVIGNDVWICENVTILEGVSIADGVVVGANALVTEDLEPYGIYAGVPAKKIGCRFESDVVDFLLKFKWWNKPEAWISENAELFSDIKLFVSKLNINRIE